MTQKHLSNDEFKTELANLKREVSHQTRKLESQTDRLRLLTMKLLRTQQDERNRLSSILHDHIQPLIVGARMQVWEIQRKKDPGTIQKTAEKLEEIIAQTLESLRSLSVELCPSTLQNNGLAGGINWLKTYMDKQFGFTVTVSIAGDIEPIQEETSFLIFEAAKELLLNAAKHAHVSEADVFLRRTDEDLIVLIVSDRGKGFDPNLIEQFSIETATLGLFSIQERLNSIGGGMLIETEADKGTKITLTAPAGMERQTTEAQPATDSDRSIPERISDRFYIKEGMIGILIVDDHKVLREGLKSLLQAEPDFHVLGEADSGRQGIEMAAELEPDVVLMDVNLGDIHGIQATQQIMMNRPGTRVIGLSMHDDQGVIDAMNQAGAVNYLTKNSPVEKILKTIRSSLE
ncbi:MAG: response regulator [Desulfobacteraceae bacterium]|nr:MAG: response regulator [Desulfobacteraceae bacterium]